MSAALPTVIVQARMGSRRLPGKVLVDLCGAPILTWLVERVAASERVGAVVVATTTDPADDAVEKLAGELEVGCFRGHPRDVLGRFSAAAAAFEAEVVVRVSGDSPFLDAVPVDAVLADFSAGGADLVENHRRPGWPVGTAAEALSRGTLERIVASTHEPRHREHVTIYAYEASDITTRHVAPAPELEAPDLRLCVDTDSDLRRLRRICAGLGPDRTFRLPEIIEFARDNPEAVA
jgi:spore coat polysaccharide biosynthesis protein SpsF